MAEVRDEWLKKHIHQNTSRTSKDSVQLLEPLALSPDQTRQTLSHRHHLPTPHYPLSTLLWFSKPFLLWAPDICFLLLYYYLLFYSTLVATATAIRRLVSKSTGLNQNLIYRLFVQTTHIPLEFCALQLKFETCRKGWLYVGLYKISTLHMVCPVIQREM
jgi:hypothetical protein